MNKLFKILVLTFFSAGMITSTGCKKNVEIPTLITTVASDITSTSGVVGGNVTNDGGAKVTGRGICWNTSENPTIANSTTLDGTGAGSFSRSLAQLLPNTKYYVRAYATNSVGTGYGNQVSFTTSSNVIATLNTTSVIEIRVGSAVSGGNIADDGGGDISSRGICWNTSENPTTSNSKTSDGIGIGSFSSSLSLLIPNTKYYVRAYATNSAGTAYGNQVSFITSQIVYATLTTTEVTEIRVESAVSGGNITDNGGTYLTAWGVCWGTTSNPTTNNNKTTEVDTSSFISTINGLKPSTKYYIRAYATNSAGTAYGNELSFTTSTIGSIIFNHDLTYGSISDIDGNIYKTIQIGTQLWMAENLKTTRYNEGTSIPDVTDNNEWTNLTKGGYSWYNNDESSFKTTYGALYNWYAVTDHRNLCPTGWHVPTDKEWNTLYIYIGDDAGKVKETGTTHWLSPNTGATNETGFTGLAGGIRWDSPVNQFGDIGFTGSWWSATSVDPSGLGADIFSEDYLTGGSNFWNEGNQINKTNGGSVRCLKDN